MQRSFMNTSIIGPDFFSVWFYPDLGTIVSFFVCDYANCLAKIPKNILFKFRPAEKVDRMHILRNKKIVCLSSNYYFTRREDGKIIFSLQISARDLCIFENFQTFQNFHVETQGNFINTWKIGPDFFVVWFYSDQETLSNKIHFSGVLFFVRDLTNHVVTARIFSIGTGNFDWLLIRSIAQRNKRVIDTYHALSWVQICFVVSLKIIL